MDFIWIEYRLNIEQILKKYWGSNRERNMNGM